MHGLALNALQGTQQLIPTFAAQVINSFVTPAGLMFLLLLFSIILRREWIAVGLFWLLLAVIGALGRAPADRLGVRRGDPPRCSSSSLRFGLLTMVTMQFFLFMFIFYPVTTDFSAWYAGSTSSPSPSPSPSWPTASTPRSPARNSSAATSLGSGRDSKQ